MKINWKVRFKNKAWLAAFLGAIVTFVYQLLGMLGVVSPISEDMATQIVGIILNVLLAFGIIQDPTTTGASDSARALNYDCPAGNCKVNPDPEQDQEADAAE